MESFIVAAAIPFLAGKAIELLKYLKNKDWNGAVTLVSVWVAGIVALVIAAAAEVTETFVVPGTTIPLGSLDGPSLVLLGMTLTSITSTVYDFKKALDSTDSAKQPPLITNDTDSG